MSEYSIAEVVYYSRPLKATHKGFFFGTFKKSMQKWMEDYYSVMKSHPKVYGYRPLVAIEYKYNSGKVIEFIYNEGGVSTETCVPYLSHFLYSYSNVSICPVFQPHVIGIYLNVCD